MGKPVKLQGRECRKCGVYRLREEFRWFSDKKTICTPCAKARPNRKTDAELPCGVCQAVKPRSEFYIYAKTGAARSCCKGCDKTQNTRTRLTYTCKECGQSKQGKDFEINRLRKGNLVCLDCKPKRMFYRRLGPAPLPCTKCHEYQPITKFAIRTNRSGSLSYGTECYGCNSIRTQEYFRNRSVTRKRDKGPDIQYDYAFARDVLHLSHRSILSWLASGYRIEMDDIVTWKLESAPEWVPDELAAA